MGEINSPGNAKNFDSVGKKPSGKQDQGSGETVNNYVKVNTGNAGGTTISTEFKCAIGKVPTGEKTGGL